jgi:AcrR family transcriptional regulator
MTVEITRTDRRRARTRAALITAAQQLLAEGRTEVSIQEITSRADVGFGSFYNHFADKSQLWTAAITATLSAHGCLVAALTVDIDDPAAIFCVGMRLTGRLQRLYPQLARVLLNTGMGRILAAEGITIRALADLTAGIEAGRFDVSDPQLALALASAAQLGLLQYLDADPTADAAKLADEVAFRTLVSFGLGRAEARRLVARPLPAVQQSGIGQARLEDAATSDPG